MKFAKVMFSEVFVCSQERLCPEVLCPVRSLSRGVSALRVSVQWGLCPGRSLSREIYLQGNSLSRVSLSREISVQEGLCPGGSLSRGISVQVGPLSMEGLYPGVCPGGLCPGVSVQGVPGGICPVGCLSRRGSLSGSGLCQGDSRMVTCRQYPSYWVYHPSCPLFTPSPLAQC